MRKTMALFLALSGLLTAGGALAENQYYTVNTPVSIEQNTVYSAVIDANEGWKWNISDHMDVTAWLVDVQGNPAFENQTGIATAQLIYGAAEGEEEEVPVALQIDIDAAKIEGFTHNGSFDLYVKPLGKGAIWAAGNNHGQYQNSAEKLGEIKIPAIIVDGEITGNANKELELTQDSVKLTLRMDGVDDAKIDVTGTQIELLDGDGYYTYQYTFEPGVLDAQWQNGESTYRFGNVSGVFSPQGGDGNGHYRFRIGISGLKYNGLPLSEAIVRTDLYTFGRTFAVDGGSIIRNTQPEWKTDAEIPVLCDAYPDTFSAEWPVGYDASGVTMDDVSIRLLSEYGDELTLEAEKDFTVQADRAQTKIDVSYIYWAYAPVYTTMRVEISNAHVTCDELMYEKAETFAHDYAIASVYAYSVMSGGPTGTQSWTYFGFANLTEASQVFKPATYTLMTTDENGETVYYGEDASGNGMLVKSEKEAIWFNCDEECGVRLVGQTVSYDRLYDQATEKLVGNETITFNKAYTTAETLPKAISELDGLELLPGFALGASWEDHLKWPWQSFIDEGFKGGTK